MYIFESKYVGFAATGLIERQLFNRIIDDIERFEIASNVKQTHALNTINPLFVHTSREIAKST